MGNSKTLSIIVITMNRKDQLIEALRSCLECELPSDTEFVVIDNASVDGTDEAVKSFFGNSSYSFTYKRLPENKGVGGGRNEGFELAEGKYTYFLDDDAIIDENCKTTFFPDCLKLLNDNPAIATLTTRIWDEILQDSRSVIISREGKISGCDSIFMFLGGSHFLRKAAFAHPLYLPNFIYGFEELYPSLLAFNKGLSNVYFPSAVVIHQPKIDKYDEKSSHYKGIIAMSNAGILAAKSVLYPGIFKPLLFAAFLARWYMHLRNHPGGLKDSYSSYVQRTRNVKIQKIKFTTVMRIFREFGFRAGV